MGPAGPEAGRRRPHSWAFHVNGPSAQPHRSVISGPSDPRALTLYRSSSTPAVPTDQGATGEDHTEDHQPEDSDQVTAHGRACGAGSTGAGCGAPSTCPTSGSDPTSSSTTWRTMSGVGASRARSASCSRFWASRSSMSWIEGRRGAVSLMAGTGPPSARMNPSAGRYRDGNAGPIGPGHATRPHRPQGLARQGRDASRRRQRSGTGCLRGSPGHVNGVSPSSWVSHRPHGADHPGPVRAQPRHTGSHPGPYGPHRAPEEPRPDPGRGSSGLRGWPGLLRQQCRRPRSTGPSSRPKSVDGM